MSSEQVSHKRADGDDDDTQPNDANWLLRPAPFWFTYATAWTSGFFTCMALFGLGWFRHLY